MKNLRWCFVVIVMCLSVYGANAATICGKINSNHFISVNDNPYGCLKGAKYSEAVADYTTINVRYDYVCLTYTADVSPDRELELGHHYLSNCSPQTNTYACKKESYYGSTGCSSCFGGYASKEDNHKVPSCRYCKPNYYYTGNAYGGCTPCDDGMVTSGADFHTEESCVTPSLKCSAFQYVTANGCVDCPTGSVANDAPFSHSHTSCDYCMTGYYYKGSEGCVVCPLMDQISFLAGPDMIYQRPITDCCLINNKTYTDDTGTFAISSSAAGTTPIPDEFSDCCYGG